MRVFVVPVTAALSALLFAISLLGCAGQNPDSADPDGGTVDSMSLTPSTSAEAGATSSADAGSQSQPEIDGGPRQPSCENGETCPTDTVCAPMGLCVPDCRLDEHPCPSQFPVCDQSTGVCRGQRSDGGPRPRGDGGLPPRGDGGLPPRGDGGLPPRGDGGPPPLPPCETIDDCDEDQVCAPLGFCVPDCRILERCPQRLPVCDEDTGLCTE
jgi:hypothetical protein